MATVAVDRAGTPLLDETVPSEAGPTSSRESAYSSRAAPTIQASAHPKALTAAPMVISSPTHPATNWLPRSPSSEPEFIKLLMPLESVPKPITSMAVTKMKYRPPKMATPRIARGMSRRGSCASSPSVAAASKPAKERNPNTTPRNTADVPVPAGTENTEKSRVLPFGAVPVASLIRMMTLTMRMSATVVPSMPRSTRVPSRMFAAASAHTPARAMAPTRNGAQLGWFFQMQRRSRQCAWKMPVALAVTPRYKVHVPISAHPEMTPARGASVAPTKPYTLPAWLKRWVSRTKVQAMSRTPMVASVNARGTARPTVVAVACGLMLAAIEGAIRASEMPTASHRCSSRRRCGLSVVLTSAVMVTPLLGGLRRIEGRLRPIPYSPHHPPRSAGGCWARCRTPSLHPLEFHFPFPTMMRPISHAAALHSTEFETFIHRVHRDERKLRQRRCREQELLPARTCLVTKTLLLLCILQWCAE